ESYQNGVAAAQKMLEVQPDPRTKVGLGQMLNAEGHLLVQLKKYDEAIGVFTQAAESAAYPAMPYFNLCATYYNLKRSEEAVAACDHAITPLRLIPRLRTRITLRAQSCSDKVNSNTASMPSRRARQKR
ncbi:MAG: hypothetical protein DMG79_21835, partial [Acidobacteria bacterium]